MKKKSTVYTMERTLRYREHILKGQKYLADDVVKRILPVCWSRTGCFQDVKAP